MVASLAGIGTLPAPGTAASAVTVLIGASLYAVSPWCLAMMTLVSIPLGLWAIPRAGGTHDPGWVVIDELTGQWIALLGLAHLSMIGVLAAFVLFRLFDITKPGPVGWADRQKGAVGVMSDDIIAGAMAATLLLIIRHVVVF